MSNQEPASGSPSGTFAAGGSGMHERPSLSGRFLLVIAATFLGVVALGAVFTYRFGQLSSESLRLTLDLQQTLSLNAELRRGVSEEIAGLRRQLEEEEPGFAAAYQKEHYELTEKETRYLRLHIGEPERLRVEQLRALHGELAIRAGQLLADLSRGERERAGTRLLLVERLGADMSRTLTALEELQVGKLSSVVQRLDRVVRNGQRAILTLAALLVVVLAALALYVRRAVLVPLARLQEASDALRRGDFSVRAPVLRDDEIGRLAKGFNFMAASASLRDSYASLERKVEERTRELSRLQEQLVQAAKMSAMGQLVSGVAHELNNPLTSILGFSELLKADLVESRGDAEQVERLEEIAAEADRCRRIVANLLQFARRQEPRLEPVHLNDVVERMVTMREYELGTRNVKLERRYDASDPVLLADASKLQQVVLNLLNNAGDAVLEAGRPGTIVVTTRIAGEEVVLEVVDDGLGVRAPERVFEPFYTTKEVGKGTGLGLSVCYGIVEEHRGAITIENRPEGGARVCVTLPRGSGTASGKPASQASLAAVGLPRHALVVDDEKPLIALQISFLSTLGVDAAGVLSGEDAVRYLEANAVDLVVSDVRMPGAIDGLALYDWVVANRPQLLRRFLLVSGDVVRVDQVELWKERSIPCLQKPFRLDEYTRAVRKVLEA
jgi:signal transduction histidine kinase